MQANNIAEIIANNMAQHGAAINNDLVAVEPVLQYYINDGYGATGPLVHIGYLAGEPVYRTTHTLAHHMEGNEPGDFKIHWPPLFPNIWLPQCDYLQLDVTIRKQHAPYEPPIAGDEDSDNGYEDGYDADDHDDCDHYDLADYIEDQQEIEETISLLYNIDIQWINIHNLDQ